MSTTDAGSETATRTPAPATIDMKLEVVNLPVSDIDRAKRFYHWLALGWRLRGRRRLQGGATDTAPFADCDHLWQGRHEGRAGLVSGSDADRRRHRRCSGGPDQPRRRRERGLPLREPALPQRRNRSTLAGPDPQGRSYFTWASFSDPDGNGWLLQEIKTRLPGREWED